MDAENLGTLAIEFIAAYFDALNRRDATTLREMLFYPRALDPKPRDIFIDRIVESGPFTVIESSVEDVDVPKETNHGFHGTVFVEVRVDVATHGIRTVHLPVWWFPEDTNRMVIATLPYELLSNMHPHRDKSSFKAALELEAGPVAGAMEELRETAQRIIEQVGVSELVMTSVRGVAIREAELVLDVELIYTRDHPVCCGEPACYIPFLRPLGLQEVQLKLRSIPEIPAFDLLSVRLSCTFEPGFRFLGSGWNRPEPWNTTYRA